VPYAIQQHSLEQYVLSSFNHNLSVNRLLLCMHAVYSVNPPARGGKDATIR
jgi:hypothetical protein